MYYTLLPKAFNCLMFIRQSNLPLMFIRAMVVIPHFNSYRRWTQFHLQTSTLALFSYDPCSKSNKELFSNLFLVSLSFCYLIPTVIFLNEFIAWRIHKYYRCFILVPSCVAVLCSCCGEFVRIFTLSLSTAADMFSFVIIMGMRWFSFKSRGSPFLLIFSEMLRTNAQEVLRLWSISTVGLVRKVVLVWTVGP